MYEQGKQEISDAISTVIARSNLLILWSTLRSNPPWRYKKEQNKCVYDAYHLTHLIPRRKTSNSMFHYTTMLSLHNVSFI